jgi:hypothetical protein
VGQEEGALNCVFVWGRVCQAMLHAFQPKTIIFPIHTATDFGQVVSRAARHSEWVLTGVWQVEWGKGTHL